MNYEWKLKFSQRGVRNRVPATELFESITSQKISAAKWCNPSWPTQCCPLAGASHLLFLTADYADGADEAENRYPQTRKMTPKKEKVGGACCKRQLASDRPKVWTRPSLRSQLRRGTCPSKFRLFGVLRGLKSSAVRTCGNLCNPRAKHPVAAESRCVIRGRQLFPE